MKLSFICPSNNPKMYRDCIIKSLERQKNRDFELILVDTLKEHYSSAAAALNAGAAKASGDYFVFLHHDIIFESDSFIDELIGIIDRCSFLIGGVAGVRKKGKHCPNRIISNIVHGENEHKRAPSNITFTDPTPLETVDECCFVIPADVFRKRNFPEFTPTWHLYAVEYCLWAHDQDIENPVLLLPARLWHLSTGDSLNQNYFSALRILRRMYRRDIISTVGAWPYSLIPFQYKVLRRRIRLFRHSIRQKRAMRKQQH